jgi:aryl-alcohol dehydrogenase-like predicted oxidoreductase
MEYATIGNTGLLVSKLCFGTMTFGDGRGIFKAISSVAQAGADELWSRRRLTGASTSLIRRTITRKVRAKRFSGNH